MLHLCAAAALIGACARERASDGSSAGGGASTQTTEGGSGGETPSGGTTGSAGGAETGGGTESGSGGGYSSTGGNGTSAGGATAIEPRVTKLGESLVTRDGLTIISYGGYLNGESFQQDGIISHGDVQYAAFWNSARHVVIAARTLPDGAWQHLELPDYKNQEDDAHNTISLGIVPADGTLHLAFDHHDSALHYRRSSPALLDQDFGTWAVEDFGDVTNALVPGKAVQQVTYPRFVTAPEGTKMLLSVRIGQSGKGALHLWEYVAAAGTWLELGGYLDGTIVDENPYLHGLRYGPSPNGGAARLSLAWCNRATPDATTNHDLMFMFSDDGGRSYLDSAGQALSMAGASPLRSTDERALVWPIAQDRGLINQEHMMVDMEGGVHVLLSHLPDGAPNDGNFTSARERTEFFHYHRDSAGAWHRNGLGASTVANFRGKLAASSAGNLYAVLPDLRIYGASKRSAYQDWQLLYEDGARFFSDPLVDHQRLVRDGVLSVFYPLRGSRDIEVVDFQIE